MSARDVIVPPGERHATHLRVAGRIHVGHGGSLRVLRLTEVQHSIHLEEGATLVASGLSLLRGELTLGRGTSFMATSLKEAARVTLAETAYLVAPNLGEIAGQLKIGPGASVDLPALATIGHGLVLRGATRSTTANLPALTRAGNLQLERYTNLVAPKLVECGDIYGEENSGLEAGALEAAGTIYLGENTRFDLPELVTIRGDLGMGVCSDLQARRLVTVAGDAHFAVGAVVATNSGSLIVLGASENDQLGGAPGVPCVKLPARGVRP